MRLSAFFAVILLATAARAETVPVGRVLLDEYSRVDEQDGMYDHIEFRCHERGQNVCGSTGHAWVDVAVIHDDGYHPDWDDLSYVEYHTQYQKFRVAGLRYNPATRQIMYRSVVCANVQKVFVSDVAYETGKCNFRHRIAPQKYREGEKIKTRYVEDIFMRVND